MGPAASAEEDGEAAVKKPRATTGADPKPQPSAQQMVAELQAMAKDEAKLVETNRATIDEGGQSEPAAVVPPSFIIGTPVSDGGVTLKPSSWTLPMSRFVDARSGTFWRR